MSEKELIQEAVEAFLGDRTVFISVCPSNHENCDCCCDDIDQTYADIETVAFDVVYHKDLDYIGTVCKTCKDAICFKQDGE